MFNSNASSADAGGANYIEDVFSTWLYTGNGSTQTITNGIDLAGEGGLVWTKNRTSAFDNYLYDTDRGVNKVLLSNNTIDQQSLANTLTAFNSNGFTLGGSDYGNITPGNAAVSWTFRQQPKFFDVVTYTGNGTAGRTIAHNLGSAPGCVIVKCTSDIDGWVVQHRSLNTTSGQTIQLDSTGAAYTANVIWNSTAATSTVFTVGNDGSVNGSGRTYVAYLFAHDAGGFGLTGTDNVISCGSYTGNGSTTGPIVTLGYEPQWVMIKNTSDATNWVLVDTMRGMSQTGSRRLNPNLSAAESGSSNSDAAPLPTGFQVRDDGGSVNASGNTYIYIAIRRGPMKVPTTGTSVFVPVTSSATGSVLTSNFPVDMGLIAGRGAVERGINDRLRGIANTDPGPSPWLVTQSTAAETLNSNFPSLYNANNTSIQTGGYFGSAPAVSYLFRRAPGFFDEVCYTGNGGAQTIKHNLNVVPELIIGRNRTGSNWSVNFNFATTTQSYAFLNLTDSGGNLSYAGAGVFSGAPTSTEMYLVNSGSMNGSGQGIVAYLFASCPGVSKIGVYTGTATTLQINCGFTAGTRFVLIKRTDAAGDWYVWDSARGIVAGDDPYLLLNSTAAEVTGTDYVDTYSAGFELTSTAPAAINASGGTYLFLAIA